MAAPDTSLAAAPRAPEAGPPGGVAPGARKRTAAGKSRAGAVGALLADDPLYKSDAFRISAYKVLMCTSRAQHEW